MKKIQKKTTAELVKMVRELKEELAKENEHQATKGPQRTQKRRDVARLLTELNARRHGEAA